MAIRMRVVAKDVLLQTTRNRSSIDSCTCSFFTNFYRKNLFRYDSKLSALRRSFSILSSLNCSDPNVAYSRKETLTHFGFENVTESEKKQKVYDVFANVAESYDLMNDVMSGGLHRLWKDYFVRKCNPLPGKRLLDVAGGTGDIAFRYLDGVLSRLKKEDIDLASLSKDVVVCDINKSMLEVGRRRAQLLGIEKALSFAVTDAEKLQFEDDAFDLYTIAFGIRNVTHIDKVLEEAHRVLRPGGSFMCLEFSDVSNPFIKSIYDGYSFQIIPVIGQVIAQDWNSYKYLVESIRQFPDQDTFSSMVEDAGFSSVSYENLLFGVVSIHRGFKI